MSDDNVIELAAYRGEAVHEPAPARSAERDAERLKEADALLGKLHRTKRILQDDRSILVGNLGRLIDDMNVENRMELAAKILDTKWPKRKRYVRFPDEVPDPSTPYAASGLDFASIIQGIVDKKVSQGVDLTHATIETVNSALKRTSFRSPSPFQMPEGIDERDAAFFMSEMEKVFEKLAHEADLTGYFELISKFPIYPDREWTTQSSSLELNAKFAPNDLYLWHWYTEEDQFDQLHDWIPWWAPRCVIGHLYIPFQCPQLKLPPHAVSALEKACGGKVTWTGHDYSRLLKPFLRPEWIHSTRVFHRLPIWLMALPLPNRLVPCLYAALYRPVGFLPKEHYPSYDDPVVPCFADKIGKLITDDAVYFDANHDDYETLYLCVSDGGILVIGSGVEDMWNFKAELCFQEIDELPEWLQTHPVQRLLKLTMDSDEGKSFSLSARSYADNIEWLIVDEGPVTPEEISRFRPAFPDDPITQYTPLRQNTIAAYLLRNFTYAIDGSIFEALKEDILARAMPARKLIDHKLSKFRAAFDERFGPSNPTT
jgi:hypothetical protein